MATTSDSRPCHTSKKSLSDGTQLTAKQRQLARTARIGTRARFPRIVIAGWLISAVAQVWLSKPPVAK